MINDEVSNMNNVDSTIENAVMRAERKTAMTEYELKFYEAGIKDANEARHIVFAAHSERYAQLCRQLHSQIGDPRGNATVAYNNGVAHEINRQTKLEF